MQWNKQWNFFLKKSMSKSILTKLKCTIPKLHLRMQFAYKLFQVIRNPKNFLCCPHYQKKHVQLGHDSWKINPFIFSLHLQLVVLTIFLSGLLVLRIATTLCCVGCPKILHFWPNISYWPNLHPLELNVLKKRGEILGKRNNLAIDTYC